MCHCCVYDISDISIVWPSAQGVQPVQVSWLNQIKVSLPRGHVIPLGPCHHVPCGLICRVNKFDD